MTNNHSLVDACKSIESGLVHCNADALRISGSRSQALLRTTSSAGLVLILYFSVPARRPGELKSVIVPYNRCVCDVSAHAGDARADHPLATRQEAEYEATAESQRRKHNALEDFSNNDACSSKGIWKKKDAPSTQGKGAVPPEDWYAGMLSAIGLPVW